MAAKITRAATREFAERPRGLRTCRDVDSSMSDSMSCSVMEMDDFEFEWTVRYDEYIYVLDGLLTIELEDGTHELHPGDSLWLSNGTWHFYHVKKARVVVVVYQANWSQATAVDT